jgi:hypothetical protein
MCFYLKAACFGLGIEHHQDTEYAGTKTEIKMKYTKHNP